MRFDELAPHGMEMLLDFETTNMSFDTWPKEKYMIIWCQYVYDLGFLCLEYMECDLVLKELGS